MFETETKFKVGDIVNCTVEGEGFMDWINAKVIAVFPSALYPYECTCDRYPGETGIFRERELELASNV